MRILRIAVLVCLPVACGQATSSDPSDIENSSSITGTDSSATSAAGTGGTSATSSGSDTTGAVATGGSGAAGSGGSSPSTTGSVDNGAPCFDDDDCVAPQYCRTPPGRCGQSGQCSQKPSACDANFAPVCGCNGMTYGNRCEAEAAGEDIYVDGSCQEVPDGCTIFREGEAGCYGVRHCQRSEECPLVICRAVCQFPTGSCPDEGDPIDPDAVPTAAGRCIESPCEPSLEENPVCGCDGITYFNFDAASGRGVSVRHAGACE